MSVNDKRGEKTTLRVLTSLLVCLLFLGSRDPEPHGVLSREERDDLLKQQDAARHAWGVEDRGRSLWWT